jgi:hypothetical protein
MMVDSIRFDPNAKFDDEVARIAEEHDAVVVFELVERKAAAMAKGHSCEVCTVSTEATHRLILSKQQGNPDEHEVCQEHGMWLREGAPQSKTPPNTNEKRVEDLRPDLAAAKHIGSRAITEAPELGPGGGPGGRAMAPDLPPPPRRDDPPGDMGR